MAITVSITHLTHYKYDRPVSLSPQTIRLRPSPHNKVPIKSYSLNIEPKDHFMNWYQDIFGNHVANISFNQRVTEFKIEVDLKAEIVTSNPFDFFIDKKYEQWPFEYDLTNKIELGSYLNIIENGPLLNKWIMEKTAGIKTKKTLDLLVYINQELNKSLGYIIRLDPGVHTPEELFKEGKGSCRDFAWTLCQIYRHLGFASRFVSGYSIQLKPDIKAIDGPIGVTEDIVDLHAWCEVYIPGAGWIGFDGTSGLMAGEGHIPLSASPLPFQSAPVEGLIDKCECVLDHRMILKRIAEPPRVTKPFSQHQWNEINKLGKKIDAAGKKADLRLTIGGEPTFISTENRDALEWNTAALGDEKWDKAVELLFRLRKKFGPQASVHFGQGKWYGGESMPRWALGFFWRKDGQKVWNNDELIAQPNRKKPAKINPEQTEKFAKKLSQSLGIDENCAIPAYEDIPHILMRERILPIAGKIIDEAANDDEIKRLLKLDKKDLGKPRAFVLPILYSIKRKKWISNLWKFKSDHMFLIPGDSAAGFRMPLNSIPFVKGADEEVPPLRSNFDNLPKLPEWTKLYKNAQNNLKKIPDPKESAYLKKDPNGYVRTAICIEARDGALRVFLPPTYYAEHYLELVASIEATADALKIPVIIEGYEPPRDLRMENFHVTPDPGVIEVNVHPASNWDELKFINETIYDEAAKIKLTAEKFLLDGKRTGTGGGNHIIAGGATPDESPFLRRPDLLKSVITYWQNHPGLSYLFSSQFIGPTSQAPRIDEARHEGIYELEIALKQIEEGIKGKGAGVKGNKKDGTPLWLVDRLLRNILVDVSGNTHRTEICIDKLYSPDGERGRLGLLEFRGFEMTPHARMNLLQVLLIQALITKFWKHPYKAKLIPWGNKLHDQFMLPHFVWEDFLHVLADLKEYGFEFKKEWFMPQFDFRFPLNGTYETDGITIELRSALEPWPVLGEENVAGATSRGVDAALERLQLKVTGLDESLFAITCNGVRVNLHNASTLDSDTKISGIKFKAWDPPFTMHPNLKINSPLTFDIVDLNSKYTIGGCKYHVFHPGGRNYDTSPVNVNEAEGRVISRFEKMGHSSGKIRFKNIDPHPEFPFTLDLRRI